eukprot:GHVR01034442.1.p1 GENE.GHVR01034442.1~~GHVR01034442.1.p1  ORF type:complete len:264 (+),score=64.47 GHVR01034442.1:282-1073(+)
MQLGREKNVDIILKSGYRSNIRNICKNNNNKYLPPLHLAVDGGEAAFVLKLIKENLSDVNVINSEGRTPLMNSVMDMNENIVKCLTNISECNTNIIDNNGNTSLTEACSLIPQCPNIVLLLLNAKQAANINIRNGDGWLPIHCASYANSDQIIKILIDYGCDVNSIITNIPVLYYQGSLFPYLNILYLILIYLLGPYTVTRLLCLSLYHTPDALPHEKKTIREGCQIKVMDHTHTHTYKKMLVSQCLVMYLVVQIHMELVYLM